MAGGPGSEAGDGRASRRPAFLAGALLAFSGLVDVAAAPAAIATDPYFVLVGGHFYKIDFTGWAWLRLAVGAATALAGLAVVANRRWSARVGISAAGLGIVMAVLAFSYNPLRALLVVPVNVAAVRLILRRR